jgi:hypothetical protein
MTAYKSYLCRECKHFYGDHVKMEDGTRVCCRISLDQYNNPVWVCFCEDLPPEDNLKYLEFKLEKKEKKK